MNKARELLIIGLKNAHAMEVQARELMERQSERTSEYPEVKVQLQRHLEETKLQLHRLEKCLESCGESSSTFKDTAQSVMANTTAMAHAMAGDEILKNTFANNAFENFEIAAYKSLLTLCDLADTPQLRPHLEQSLREEEAMARWVAENVESVTKQFIAKESRQAA